jgi:hypothetical protein
MERLKDTRKALNELNESYIDLLKTTKATAQNAHDAKQLWRAGYKSRLIKIGIALVVFPEPTPASEIIGGCFIAAGAAQKAVRNRALFVEDVKKTFQTTMKEVAAIKQDIY